MKQLCALLAVLFASATPAFAQVSSAPAPTLPRYIVQFQSTLSGTAVNLADSRVRDKYGFGNLRPEVMGHIQRLEKAYGLKAQHGFSKVLKGFSAHLTAAQLARLKADPQVLRIELDAKVKATAQSVPWGIAGTGATAATAIRAGDGLDNSAPLGSVRVFVLDTGISAHPDLNVVERLNYVGDGIDYDCNGHGTHVAGTIGAKDDAGFVVGVAPGVSLTAAKVLDCNGSGYASNLIKAFDYVAATSAANPGVKYVANASVGFPAGTVIASLDTALKNAVSAGVFIAVAAGNSADNTCGSTMVGLSSGTTGTGVMAVSAADSAGNEASFSSYGSCVAVWAPGVSVLSDSNADGITTMSGTSMASPHVAGAAAMVRAVYPQWSPVQVDAYLKSTTATSGAASKDGRLVAHLNVSQLSGSTDPVPAPTPAPQPAPTPVSIATVTSGTLDFGLVKRNSASPSRKVMVTNSGNVTMSLTALTNLPLVLKPVASTCSNVLPGSSCYITLQLNTTKRTVFSATVSTVGATTNGKFAVKGTVY